MRKISCWFGLAAITLAFAGCFPAVDKGDVSEVDLDTSGPDTSAGGDSEPQLDTSTADTATPDTLAPDTLAPDTTVTDTVAPECDGPEDCGHLAGTCTKVVCLGGTCAAQPDDGGGCDDGNACTKDDVCSGFSCSGTAYACDDGEVCTDDVCDGQGGCDYPVKAGGCWIGGACYAIGETKPGDPCRVCAGGESWSPNDGATCSDGDDVCTLGDTCDGTQCVGGPPPDDSAGDWATNVVLSTAPQRSAIAAIHPVGIADWALFASLDGGGRVPTSNGNIDFPNHTVALVRRAPASTWVDASFTGTGSAALTASTSSNGALAWSVELTGTGEARFDPKLITKATTPPVSYVAVSDSFGDLRFLVEAVGTPRSLALAGGDSVVQGYVTSGTYLDADGQATEIAPGDVSNTAVVRYAFDGTPTWGGVVRTPGFASGYPTMCRVEGGDVAIAAAFRGSASVELGPAVVPVTSTKTTFVVARFDGETAATVLTPLTFSDEIQPGSQLVSAPTMFCDPSGFTLVLDSTTRVVESISASGALVGGTSGTGVVRFDWDGQPLWATNVLGGFVVGAAQRAFRLALNVNTSLDPTNATVAAPGGTPLGDLIGATRWILVLHSSGAVDWAQHLPGAGAGFFSTLGLQGNSDTLAVAAGGSFAGASLDWSALSPDLVWSGNSDRNAFAALLNSAAGLSCAAP
ncbi:MAG: hypothetical protein CVU56_12590 [Deltaproteobacteria bacterium HGW-Deltaproteobacteria-14]|jgi:hypothetical protein|nr:MAG: hypothetical protein CVU56_12590 [Deltaproteobacteria bacterium HGW-Deltaproteobacteria-14]